MRRSVFLLVLLWIFCLLSQKVTADVLLPQDLGALDLGSTTVLVVGFDERPHLIPTGDIKAAFATSLMQDGWLQNYEGLPAMLPGPERLGAVFARYGLSARSAVLVMAGDASLASQIAAARISWTLAVAGVKDRFFYSGGLPAWEGPIRRDDAGKPAEGLRVGAVTDLTYNDRFLASADSAFAGADYGTPPIDLRDGAYYRGEKGPDAVGLNRGTLPGAEHVPAVALTTKNGRLKSREDLAHLFHDILADPPGPIITFSNRGLAAALGWLVLRDILGHRDVRLYDGSFLDWQGRGREVEDKSDDMGGVIGQFLREHRPPA